MKTFKELTKDLPKKKWEEITKEDLIEMAYRKNVPDAMIAEFYNVKKSQVSYKRKKHGIIISSEAPEFKKYCIRVIRESQGISERSRKEAIEALESLM